MSADKGITRRAPRAEVREALHELQRYFSDELAPMMVAEAVELLIKLPPQVVASAIHGWIGTQYRGAGADVPISDYLFHAVKKLHQLTEYELIDRAVMAAFLAPLNRLVLTICPEADRKLLAQSLHRLGEAPESTTVGQVAVLHRQAGEGKTRSSAQSAGGAGGSAGGSGGVTRGMKRLSVLLERLGDTAADGGQPARVELAPRALVTAAVQAGSGEELGHYLTQLRSVGVDTNMEKVFRALGNTIPGWALAVPEGAESTAAVPPSRSVDAMHRLIATAGDAEEGGHRFNEMIRAAIEQFNQGSLAQAAAMIDLAKRIVDEKQLGDEVVNDIRRRSQETLEAEALLRYASKSEKHKLLRKVLNFFPAFTVRGLLTDLSCEPKRERRKLMLAVLEAHGHEARDAALEQLQSYVQNPTSDPHGYFQRNLVFLLRRIPPSEDDSQEAELGLLLHLSSWGTPLIVIREVIAALGQMHHDKAEETLITRLQDVEQMLVDRSAEAYEADDLRALLDWIAAALARLGTPDALRAVADHAFERHAALGDTLARIEELAGHDLSGDAELVRRLVAAVRRELPTRVLGLVVGKNDANIVHLIRALSHTPLPEVHQLLEGIAKRYGDRSFAAEASKALSGFGVLRSQEKSEPEAESSLTGDVELFGLPNLLQSLADSQVSGTLKLLDPECETIASMLFEGGKIRGCQAGSLHGESAFYQLFEKPTPGTFQFKRRHDARPPTAEGETPAMDVMPAILEAMRRHDEFQQARAIVPDDVALQPTGTKPTPLEDERDLAFIRGVWVKASSGFTPEQCETALSVDSYRVRRLFAHWVEIGALEPRHAAAPQPASRGTSR